VHRRVLGVSVAIWLLAGCAGSAAPASTVAPTPTPIATAGATTSASMATASGSPAPVPTTFGTVTSGGWTRVLATPDSYVGKGLQLWGCITQLDAAKSADTFGAQASYRVEPDWSKGGKAATFTGTRATLAGLKKSDVVAMKVVGRGLAASGGAAALPQFDVVEIAKVGSCR
jgi:hypothetical protein